MEVVDYLIKSGSASVNFDVVLIHVGSNNVNSCKLADFDYYYNQLITTDKRYTKPSTKVILSAVIPRPLDYDFTKNLVIAVNKSVKHNCNRRPVGFVATYKLFLKFSRPICALYSPLCNLHLNYFGILKLTNFYIQVLSHC